MNETRGFNADTNGQARPFPRAAQRRRVSEQRAKPGWFSSQRAGWEKQGSLTDDEDADEPNYSELHIVIVEEDVG
jgi:hypothetical protein